MLSAYIERESGSDPATVTPALRRELEIKLQKIRAAAALGENVKEAQPRIELARLELLAQAAANSAGVYALPSEDEIRVAYQHYLRSLPASEYHVAHILVATEQLADDVLAELKRGQPFAEVAKARSTDDSKVRGGDLGWIRQGGLPEPLFAALGGLEPDQYSTVPIHTAYGWHVVQLLGERASDAPSLDRVRDQLVANLQHQRYEAFLDDSLIRTPAPH